jgi:PAS domain S-box-containing protein
VALTVILAKLQQKAALLAGANRDLKESVLEVARKEAESRAILEGAADGILSLDDQGQIRSMNPTAERLFGHPAGTVLGRPFESLVSSSWTTLKTRLGLKQEMLGTKKDGTFVSLELILTGIDVGSRKVYIALLQDITERKRVDSLKDEFVSTVSHELRTPLTSIRGSLGLISHGVIGVLPPTVKNMLDIAVKNCDRLVGLVNDILDVEKIASGKMVLKMRAFELGPLLAQAVEVNRPFADSCGVQLEFQAAPKSCVVFGDTDRLMQVLTNLVSNACKFSPRGETVSLRISPSGSKVRVSVTDRGPGIPEDFRSRMFQKFAQAAGGDAGTKKGTGLGLAISKAFIEKMGGSIGFTTETGKGSTFYFELEERKPEMAAADPDRRKPRVLICEDEPNIAIVLKEMLARDGFASDVAMTLTEARRLLGKEKYAAMTLDLILPDGYAVPFMKEVRECPQTAEMPIIVVSACLEADQRQLGGQAFSIIDWLEKPISPERLSRALARAGKGVGGARAKILHVEDDPDICQVVRSLLQDSAVVDQAGSVLDAWEKLKKEDYDLLLLDVGLPDGSGLELLPALRKSSSKPIPSVVFSAHELSPRTSKYVSAALLKSKTTNEELVRRIQSLLPSPKPPEVASQSLEIGR